MGVNEYYEELSFPDGEKIHVSRQVDMGRDGAVHWHQCVEVLVSRRDGNEATVNFTSWALNRNDLVVVCPGDLHAVRATEPEGLLVMQFPVALLAVMGALKALLPRLSRLGCLRYDAQSPDWAAMMAHIQAIEARYFSGDDFREVRMYASLLELFALVGKLCLKAGQDESDTGANTEQANLKLMAEACLYITENCGKPMTLGDVATKVGVSKSHFAHLFKSYTGMTFIDFLTAQRLKLAETFFANPRLHIIDIAFESGFSSISSFNRAFRRAKGCSPTQYRATLPGEQGTGN